MKFSIIVNKNDLVAQIDPVILCLLIILGSHKASFKKVAPGINFNKIVNKLSKTVFLVVLIWFSRLVVDNSRYSSC